MDNNIKLKPLIAEQKKAVNVKISLADYDLIKKFGAGIVGHGIQNLIDQTRDSIKQSITKSHGRSATKARRN